MDFTPDESTADLTALTADIASAITADRPARKRSASASGSWLTGRSKAAASLVG